MKKINTAPISGMQELLPTLERRFERLKAGILEVYLRAGYQLIETPMIERTEVLLAKAGGETEKQIYKVIKTEQGADEAKEALRFDHTVPLARYVVEHESELPFPFKVTQVGRNFRGERAQKGRFREFYQCDIDVVGRGNLSIRYDADVIATLMRALKVLPLPSIQVRVSNRKLLGGVLTAMNLEQVAGQIFQIVDRAEKVSPEATRGALEELGIGSEYVEQILEFTAIRGSLSEVLPRLEGLGVENEIFAAGLSELKEVMELLGESEEVVADMTIVRGLDYYTGTVFETIVPEYREIGSVCSGGRYENLASNYTDQVFPGVGGSIGLTRLFFILREYGLLENADAKAVEYAVIPISEAEMGAAMELAEKLRENDHNVDVVLLEKGLGDKLKYAGKVAQYAIVVGADEVASGTYEIKNLETGEKNVLLI